LAKAVKRSVTAATLAWAWVLRMYMVSNAVLWYQVLVNKVLPLVAAAGSSSNETYEGVPQS
jgi:hypothetical protein